MAIRRGTAGNDRLVGTSTADIMYGFGGNDVMFGLGGNDDMDGGTGNDQLFGGTGNDDMEGGAGNDIVNGEAGNDILDGDAGVDRVSGGLGKFLEKDRQFLHIIVSRHLPEQISRGESKAHALFPVGGEWDRVEVRVDACATDHVGNAAYICKHCQALPTHHSFH